MRLFTREDLHLLLQSSGGYHVSFFMPTHSISPESEQDPIRFKNLIRQAEEELTLAGGLKTSEIQSILEPAKTLLFNSFFWKHQRKGLAVFLAPWGMKYFRVSQTFREMTVVSQRFHLKPLVPLLSRNEQFYILAFSPTLVRFFQCNRDSIEQVEIEGMLNNIKEMNGKQDFETHINHRFVGSGGAGNSNSVVYGGGDFADKEPLKRFYRLINHSISTALGDSKDPLVLASTEANMAIYKEVNSYAGLFKNGISGNPDEEEPKDLLQKGFPLVRNLFKKERTEAEEKYQQLSGTGRTSTEIEQLVNQARQGQIDTLFVARGINQWGQVDEKNGTVVLHDKYEIEDEDLLSYCSIQTILNKGTVFSMKPEFMPDKKNISAILRY